VSGLAPAGNEIVVPTRRPLHAVLPILRQQWRTVAFLHWPIESRLIQRLLPPGLVVDTYDDSAWVTLTPFSTTSRIGGVLPMPGEVRFPEMNVRTYVRGPDGRDGLWFFSLAATNRSNVLLGRWGGLPYELT